MLPLVLASFLHVNVTQLNKKLYTGFSPRGVPIVKKRKDEFSLSIILRTRLIDICGGDIYYL